jgi:GNAT superfamily N-acetyltransferase
LDHTLASLQLASMAEEWPGSVPPTIEIVQRRVALARAFGIDGEATLALDALGHAHIHVQRLAPRFTGLAFNGSGVAVGMADLLPNSVRQGEARLRLWVAREARGTGIGRALIKDAASCAARSGIQVLRARTLSLAPSGERFARALGGAVTTRVKHIELDVRERTVDARGSREHGIRAVSLELFEGDYPSEACAREVARLKQEVSRRYGTNGALVSVEQSVASIKRRRESLAAMGIETWTIAAFTSSRACVGYTEYHWDPAQPTVLTHESMAVDQDHRDGRVAAQLTGARRLLLEQKPSVTAVRYARLCGALAPEQESGDGVPGVHHFECQWRLIPNHVLALVERRS